MYWTSLFSDEEVHIGWTGKVVLCTEWIGKCDVWVTAVRGCMQVTVYWERLHAGYCVLGEVACRLLCTGRGWVTVYCERLHAGYCVLGEVAWQVTVYWERLHAGYCVLGEVACRLLCTGRGCM